MRILIAIVMISLTSLGMAMTDNSNNLTTIEAKDFYEINNPQLFATDFYASSIKDMTESLKTITFSKDLMMLYRPVAEKDAKTNGVGCLNDFNNATGLQEVPFGFWVGEAVTQNNLIVVPVYLNNGQVISTKKKPDVNLILVKTPQGFKVHDIEYLAKHSSLRDKIRNCS